jgi:hypothetical protein
MSPRRERKLVSRRRGQRAGQACADARRRERAAWRVPLRRAYRTIDSTLRRIGTSGRLIDATLRFAGGRPAEASRRLQLASQWIAKADEQLQRAARGVEDSIHAIVLLPEQILETPLLITATTLHWIGASMRLDQVSLHLVAATASLAFDARNRAALLDICRDVAVPQSRRRSSPVTPWRPRFLTATTADAARKVSRGRAPPPFQSALSSHRR